MKFTFQRWGIHVELHLIDVDPTDGDISLGFLVSYKGIGLDAVLYFFWR